MEYFNWLRYCVFLDHPLSTADDKLLTEVTGLPSTNSKSLKKYFLRVGHLTALKVREILPDDFGNLFDGWTLCYFGSFVYERWNSTHSFAGMLSNGYTR